MEWGYWEKREWSSEIEIITWRNSKRFNLKWNEWLRFCYKILKLKVIKINVWL